MCQRKPQNRKIQTLLLLSGFNTAALVHLGVLYWVSCDQMDHILKMM